MIEVREARTSREVQAFAELPFALYASTPQWVPPLLSDMLETLDPARNPSFDEAEARLFVAFRDGQPVGRVAAILSHAANRVHGTRNLRFGWFDVVDDAEVAGALVASLEDWARQLGLETITGPQGFCDLDPQGLLTEGFEHVPTIASIYNHPYYPRLLEGLGFRKDADYVELQLRRSDQVGIPPQVARVASVVERRSGVRMLTVRSRREALRWVPQMLDVLNESFQGLYGTVPLSERQIRHVTWKYIPFADPEFLLGAVDGDERLVAFCLALPSLSRAFQKAGGRLLPLGWWHILRGLRQRDVLDLYLIGVRPRFQRKGVPALLLVRLYEKAMEKGFRLAESNPILETNRMSLGLYEPFNPALVRRRRVYKKEVGPARGPS